MIKINSIGMCNSPNLYATNTIVSEYIRLCVCVTQSCLTLCDPQAPLSVGCSGKEYWSGLPFPTAGDLPDPGFEPKSLPSSYIGRQILYHCTTWEAICNTLYLKMNKTFNFHFYMFIFPF